MIIAIHQPQYLPWLGYFVKMNRVDKFVILDDVQYKKNEWQNRNRIPNDQGWQWLTVPTKYRFKERICEVKIKNEINWKHKHYQALLTNYNQAPAFKDYQYFFKDSYEKNWTKLLSLNIYLIKNLKKFLGIKTDLVLSSALGVTGEKTLRLVGICKKLQANVYLSGSGGRNYLDLDEFKKVGIKVRFQNFCPLHYPQQFNKKGFQENMSVIDLLFNCGRNSLDILNASPRKL